MFAMRVFVIGLALVGLAHAAHGAERRPVPLRGSYDPAAPVHRAPVPARAAAPIRAAEPIIVSKDPVPPAAYAPPPLRESYDFHYEIGVRYWYSTGKLAKDLHDDPRFTETLNSRLTYSGLDAHAGEIFGRVAHIDGPFIKGYAGLAGLDAGSLNDEDFPPNTVPYSSTDSDQRGGTLGYVSADIGYAFLAWPWVRLGLFAGYHYLAPRSPTPCSSSARMPRGIRFGSASRRTSG